VGRPYLDTGAEFSPCGEYRYALWRRLSMGERAVAFVGLNPSTADATMDDPTIRRCVGFARAWGFDWLYMLNLHAFRSTDPRVLATEIDPVGPGNWEALQRLTQKADLVVAAWGANDLHGAAVEYARRLAALPRTHCLGRTKGGSPKHPLYLAAATPLVPLQPEPRP
jgi:hypothetical protein